jgi:hypothetical protein
VHYQLTGPERPAPAGRLRRMLNAAGWLLLALAFFWLVFSPDAIPDAWYGVLAKVLLSFFGALHAADAVRLIRGSPRS